MYSRSTVAARCCDGTCEAIQAWDSLRKPPPRGWWSGSKRFAADDWPWVISFNSPPTRQSRTNPGSVSSSWSVLSSPGSTNRTSAGPTPISVHFSNSSTCGMKKHRTCESRGSHCDWQITPRHPRSRTRSTRRSPGEWISTRPRKMRFRGDRWRSRAGRISAKICSRRSRSKNASSRR